MAHLSRLIATLPIPQHDEPIGALLLERIPGSECITTLLDCFVQTKKPALLSLDPGKPALSHQELRDFISNFALLSYTIKKKLGPNDVVMVVLPEGLECALAVLSLICYHCAVLLPFTITSSDLRHYAQHLGAKVIFTVPGEEARLKTQELSSDLDLDVICLKPQATGATGTFDAVLATSVESSAPQRSTQTSKLHSLQDRSLILLSSRSDGSTQTVCYKAESLIVSACTVIKAWDLHETDVTIPQILLSECYGIVGSLLSTLLSGGSVLVPSCTDPSIFWTSIINNRVTWYCAPSSTQQRILRAKPPDLLPVRDTNIRLICIPGSGFPCSVAQNVSKVFEAVVLPCHGIPECMQIANPPMDYHLQRSSSSGISCGPHVSIRDPVAIERELPSGYSGVICVQGPSTIVGNVEANASDQPHSSHAWCDTGDVGHLDQDGYLFLQGHSSEMIHRGHTTISPVEVEDAVLSVAADIVTDVLAFSVPHDILHQTVAIAIVCSPFLPRPSLADLHARLTDSLARTKLPFVIVYMNSIPESVLGRPIRSGLSSRLGLPVQTDKIPWIHRHYEASLDHRCSSDPISCSQVAIDLKLARRALYDLPDVIEAAARELSDGTLQAAVYTANGTLTATSVKTSLRHVLPGYNVPETVFVLQEPLPRSEDHIDFDSVQRMSETSSLRLSSTSLVVRGVVADLLGKEKTLITGDSDFFLLGGLPASLGQLSHTILQETGCKLSIGDLCLTSTINGMAALLDAKMATAKLTRKPTYSEESHGTSFSASHLYNAALENDECGRGFETMLSALGELDSNPRHNGPCRGQRHPLVVLVQIIPVVFFLPLRSAWIWTFALTLLSYLTNHLKANAWTQSVAIFVGVFAAWLSAYILAPLVSIALKWLVVGRYRPGKYRLYSNYHLRWWFVDVCLRMSGLGIFELHPRLVRSYCQLLGARIGSNVQISPLARVAEHDLLTIHDGCRIDTATVRGFCVERDGFFSLAPVKLGRGVVINDYTEVAPGTVVPEETVLGPQASSNDQPSPAVFKDYNKHALASPNTVHCILVAYPILALAYGLCYVPWLAAIYCMAKFSDIRVSNLTSVASVVFWFSQPTTIGFFALAQVLRVVARPVLQVILGILIKRIMGIDRNSPQSAAHVGQWALTTKYVSRSLLSSECLNRAFDVVGGCPAIISFTYRAMGARIGTGVRWPRSSIYCPDPELLDIRSGAILGSEIQLHTSDSIGTAPITIGPHANIGDRTALLPGTHVGTNTIIGPGVAGSRDLICEDDSVWLLDADGEEPICNAYVKEGILGASAGPPRRTTNFLYSPSTICVISLMTACAFTAFWSIAPPATAEVLRQLYIHVPSLDLFATAWYRPLKVFGLVASLFIILHTLQSILAFGWGVIIKGLVLGRRSSDSELWDARSHERRYRLCSVLSRVLRRGYANDGLLDWITGTAYLVWFYRALGATIGEGSCVWAGGHIGEMPEPSLLSIADNVTLDNCSVVTHVPTGPDSVASKRICIADGCAVRSGAQVSAGAIMQEHSMLLEHALLACGAVAQADAVCWGWPAKQLVQRYRRSPATFEGRFEFKTDVELEKAVLAI